MGNALILTANLSPSLSRDAGGLLYSVRRMVQAVVDEGAVDVEVLGLMDGHTAEDLGQWAPLRTRVFPSRGPRALGYSPALKRTVLGSSYELLHSHGLWMHPSAVALSWSRRFKKPYIVSPHGMLDPWALRQSAWKKRLAGALYERAHLERAACLRSLCASETASMRAFGLGQPVCQIPNGVDLPPPAPAGPSPWASRLKPTDKVLLSLGRLHPKKGLPALLEAFSQALGSAGSAGDGWHLAIAGWDQGGHEALLKALAKAQGLEQRVIFTGPLFGQAKANAFAAAQGFALPSHSEGLPVAVLEAWSYGLPVLMTPECNLPEGFAQGAAIQVSTRVDDQARALDAFFRSDPAQRQAMGQRGYELVERQFTWKSIGLSMNAVYLWLLQGGPAPACVTP